MEGISINQSINQFI